MVTLTTYIDKPTAEPSWIMLWAKMAIFTVTMASCVIGFHFLKVKRIEKDLRQYDSVKRVLAGEDGFAFDEEVRL